MDEREKKIEKEPERWLCLRALAALSEDPGVEVSAPMLRVKEQNKPHFEKEIHFRQELRGVNAAQQKS